MKLLNRCRALFIGAPHEFSIALGLLSVATARLVRRIDCFFLGIIASYANDDLSAALSLSGRSSLPKSLLRLDRLCALCQSVCSLTNGIGHLFVFSRRLLKLCQVPDPGLLL